VDARTVVAHRIAAVTHVVLNRPDALNAWTPEMGQELLDVLRDAGADPDVRAVLISGTGRAFCAGADVKRARDLTPEGDPDLHSRLEQIYNPIILTVRAIPKPVVAAVNGAAAGLGFSLAMACDLVVAAESATFLLAFVHIAVMPDGGVLPHLVARTGPARANQLAMLGEKLPARTALDWGLVNEVVADATLTDAALALATRLAAAPTVALASMKERVNASLGIDLAHALEQEAAVQQRHATTADYAEGVAAFKEKRPPKFIGA
jgi:2-(1,2-epoxy-1,2-dihydrophenyl)acetyl-CoA isomerase